MLPTIGSVKMASNPAGQTGISGSTDNFIELANGSFSRKFGLNNWQWIRLAARVAFYEHPTIVPPPPTAANRFNIPPNNRFFFGFSYGTGSVVGDQLTTHAWGVSFTNGNALGAANWTSPYVEYSSYGTYMNTYKYQNGVETDLGNISQGNIVYITQATCSCQVIFFDLVRVGTDNWTPYIFFHNSVAYTNEYYPTNQFYTDIVSTAPAHNYMTWLGGTTVAHGEATYGQLDSVNISWNRDHPRIWLRDLHVIRLR